MTRILVVDDDPEITKLLEKFLSNEGYQVTIARTARRRSPPRRPPSPNWCFWTS